MKDTRKTDYDLEERLLDFAVRIIRLSERMNNSRASRHVEGQIIRSGTNPSAQHGEAQGVESRRDFAHKMKIGLKELRETERWLKIIVRVPLVEKPELLDDLLSENDQLIRIFVTSINTAKANDQE